MTTILGWPTAPTEGADRAVVDSRFGPLTLQVEDGDGATYDLVTLTDGSKALAPAPPPTEAQLAEDVRRRKREARRQANSRPHCGSCGRFIKKSTVRVIRHWENHLECDVLGHCPVHGETGVSWQE